MKKITKIILTALILIAIIFAMYCAMLVLIATTDHNWQPAGWMTLSTAICLMLAHYFYLLYDKINNKRD